MTKRIMFLRKAASGGPPPSVPPNWNPGIYMLSVTTNGWSTGVAGADGNVGSGYANAEIAQLIYSMQRFPGVLTGYAPLYQPAGIDGPALNAYNFNGIFNDFNNTQAQADAGGVVCAFAPQFKYYQNWNSTFNATAGSGFLPAYIYSGASSAYGDPPQGGSGAGWGFAPVLAAGPPQTYYYVAAALWNAGSMARYQAMLQALSTTSFNSTNGPYRGTYTPATHPLWACLNSGYNADIGQHGSSVQNLDFSTGGWLSSVQQFMTNAPSAVPNIPVGFPCGFGVSSNANGSGTVADQLAMIQSALAAQCGVSASDVYSDFGLPHDGATVLDRQRQHGIELRARVEPRRHELGGEGHLHAGDPGD